MLLAEDQDQSVVALANPLLSNLGAKTPLCQYFSTCFRCGCCFCICSFSCAASSLFASSLVRHYRDACAACHGLYEELVGPVAAFACLRQKVLGGSS